MSLKECIYTRTPPEAVGPYSQAVAAGPILVTSGQIPLNPPPAPWWRGGIREQTEQVLKNIEAVLAQAGLTMDNVIKTTVFLTDMNDFAAMNEVYAAHFGGDYPARSAVEVGAPPKGAKVEIETICIRG